MWSHRSGSSIFVGQNSEPYAIVDFGFPLIKLYNDPNSQMDFQFCLAAFHENLKNIGGIVGSGCFAFNINFAFCIHKV
jgi:hypothetical protein